MNNSEIEDTLAKLDDWAKTSRSKGRTLEQAAILIRKLRNELGRYQQTFNEKALLSLTGQMYGISADEVREYLKFVLDAEESRVSLKGEDDD